MDILDKIIIFMKQKHISQTKLTSHLGINKVVFSDWKSGKSTSYLKYISQIAEFLDVSTDYLLGNEQSKAIELPALSENKQELLKIFEQLSDRNQLKALGAIENILNNQLEAEQTKENVG